MIVFVVLREFRVSPFPFLLRRHTIRLRTADKTNEPWSEMKRSRSLADSDFEEGDEGNDNALEESGKWTASEE